MLTTTEGATLSAEHLNSANGRRLLAGSLAGAVTTSELNILAGNARGGK